MSVRRRASPLHAARAWIGALFCLVLATVTLSFEHPLILGALLLCVLGAGAAAGVGRIVARHTLLFGAPFAVLIAVANALVTRTGSTVLVEGWTVPVFGKLDITLEATVYGVLLGMRAMIVIGCGALLSAAVDSDELLRAFRRLGFRSALTAALATRMFGVLRRDAQRLHLAQKSRGEAAASPLQLVRAVLAGALDRSVDVAATLEVRGYGAARRAPRGVPRPWSRHDASFALAAVALVGMAVAAAAGSLENFSAYPRLAAGVDTGTLVLAGALAVAALLPFADRRGVEGR